MYIREFRKASRLILPLLLLIVAIAGVNMLSRTAEAAGSIAVTEINYSKSTITLQAGSADTKVYFSDSKKTNWEVISGEIGNDRKITLDISWVSALKNYVLTFKGDASTDILTVTIPKQASNFKASYNKAKNTITFGNAGARTIEWRKKGSTTWYTVNPNTFSSELSYLNNNGATLYFRLAPVNGTSVLNVGSRAGKEVTVTIPKKTAAPSIKVDGSKFSISLKKGITYRIVNSDGTTSGWNTVNSSTELLLKNIAAAAMYTGTGTKQSEVTLQFRANATSSSQVSKITTVTVPIQEGPPNIDTNGITVSYNSSTSLSLIIKAASSSVPFEYTVVKKDDELNYQTAKWKTVSTNEAVNLDKNAAPEGAHIYVRKKALEASADVNFTLASVEKDITGTDGVSYPSSAKASALTTLTATSGTCRETDSSSFLSFSLYSPTSATVTQINFLDAYGSSKGTVTCKSTVAKNSASTGINDKYVITTSITSTTGIDTITNEKLYAKITLSNSEVITSSDTSGVLLYLYPRTKVNNPANNKEYTDKFNRVYLSNDPYDSRSFKFQLDFGTAKLINTSATSSGTAGAVTVSSIKYDGYTLAKDTDYSVEYGSYLNSNNETVATATVTVKVAQFEASPLISTTDTELPLKIMLNNGETLDKDIYIKLVNTATLDNVPIAWSISEGSLKETTTSTVKNSDNTTTTVTEKVVTYTLTLTIFDKNYGVSVSDVTWGDTSIFDSAQISNGKATISLSNAKINKLTTSSSDTKDVVITFSNGYSIKKGCKLTILNVN